MSARTDLVAPNGKFRVVGVDTFAHEDYLIGDYDHHPDAIAAADASGGTMNKTYVYDDTGCCLHSAGTF